MVDSEEILVSILLLGDAEVGKSTFLSRISHGPNASQKSPNQAIALLQDTDQPFIFELRSRSGSYHLEFYDTSSPETWKLLNPDLVILCYDISSRLSLINIQRIWSPETHKLFSTTNSQLPILLLGLKRDLRSETDPNGIIYPQEAYRIAQELRCDKYMECSALSGELLAEVWEDVCQTAVKTKQGAGGQSEGTCRLM